MYSPYSLTPLKEGKKLSKYENIIPSSLHAINFKKFINSFV